MGRPKIIFKRLGKKPPRHIKCTCSAGKGTDFGEWRGNLNFRPMNGKITIDPRQPESEMLDTTIHELLHDACPYLEEGAVEVYGNHISDALWKMGWRLTKQPAVKKTSRK